MSLENLYKFDKIKKHQTSPEEVRDLFRIAKRCLNDASETRISLDLRFISAYQAALSAGEALLYCLGYKAPRNSYHYMTWEALRNIPDDNIKSNIPIFDRARQKRGDAFYEHVEIINESEFKEFFKDVKEFVLYIKDKLNKEHSALAEKINYP